jgi:hypothetical protein
MISAIQKNNIGFSANVKLCSRVEMSELTRQAKNIGHESPIFSEIKNHPDETNIEGAKTGLKLYTDGIERCHALCIVGGKTVENMMLHLDPRFFFFELGKNLKKLDEIIQTRVEKLKQGGFIPQAVIFGGRPLEEPSGTISRDQVVVLNRHLEKHGLSPTILHGEKESERSLLYDGNTNTCYANSISLRKPSLTLTTQKEMLERTSFMKVSPHDSVEFSDSGIISGTGESLNKGKIGISYEDVLKKPIYQQYLKAS